MPAVVVSEVVTAGVGTLAVEAALVVAPVVMGEVVVVLRMPGTTERVQLRSVKIVIAVASSAQQHPYPGRQKCRQEQRQDPALVTLCVFSHSAWSPHSPIMKRLLYPALTVGERPFWVVSYETGRPRAKRSKRT